MTCTHAAYQRKSEQWKEVISKQSRKNMTTTAHTSLLSVVKPAQIRIPRKSLMSRAVGIRIRVTMDTGAAGHVVLETLKHNGEPKSFVAANGERIRDLGEKTLLFKTSAGNRRNIKCGSANVVKPSYSRGRLCKLAVSLRWMKAALTFETLVMARYSSRM